MKVRIQVIDEKGREFVGETPLRLVEKTSKKPIGEFIKEKNYSGLRGGIEFLIDTGFLTTLKTSKEVHEELKKENHFHSIPSVDKRLRFLISKKILTRVQEGKIWKYAIRR